MTKTKNSIEPLQLRMDLSDGKYSAATILFPKKVAIDQAQKSLNRFYQKYELKEFSNDPKMKLWRVEDKKFSIQLSKGEDGHVQIIYLTFRKTNFKEIEAIIKKP